MPIIFISSASDSMNMIMPMNMGADDFISKPFDQSLLMAKLKAILRRAYNFSDRRSCDYPTTTTADGTVWHIKGQSDKLIPSQGELDTVIPSVILVTKDLGKALSSI